MKFQAETDLVQVLKHKLKTLYSRENIEIFDEVSLGYGIADIVICDFANPRKGGASTEVILNHSDINIYNIVQTYKNVTFDILYDTTRIPKKSISNSLIKLITCQYITQIDDFFIINKPYKLIFRNNFAIEAKLKDWKRALYQAYRYKWFAEYSYVVMDKHYAEPAIKHLDLFIKYNVGLATISTDGCLLRYFNPTRQKPFDPKMQILFCEKIKQDYTFAR